MWTLRWIPRSPRRVLDEFETWRNRYDVHDIQFFDLTAILNREWILSFSDEIVRRKLNITWQLPVGTRSETIDREVAAALRRSGCAYVCYAPESGSPETLDRIKKRVNLSRLKQSVGAAVSEGLSVKCNILLGFPDETHRNVRETLGFVLSMSRLGVHDVAISPFSPYPGTPLFERLQREGKLSAELPDEWYASLPYSDFGALKSYSQHFSLAFLRFYQFLGYVLFYGAGYLLRPLRFARLLRSLFAPRPDTKGATALRILVRRFFGRPSVSPIPLRSASSLSAR
jgi:anaerobic magnesium-protoporphyrin IX monomethyl ester cyclase